MQDYDLKNPGDNQQAQTLRINTARAISIASNEANPSKALADFLLDAATKAPGYTPPPVVPDPTAAVVKSGLQTVAATGTGTKVTLTVAGGKITAITLSE